MKRSRTHSSPAWILAGVAYLLVAPVSEAISPGTFAGAISGIVTDSGGVPQMGAAVFLFNSQDRLYRKVLTDQNGEFTFTGLNPSRYSVRVTMASFVPATKPSVLVQPGARSMLNVSLANLFSSIQLVYPGPEYRTVMSDDWKWVLRTASATRPVLRIVSAPKQVDLETSRGEIFSDTRGMLRVSGGDGGSNAGYGTDADLGTAFALATSLFGNNLLQVSGRLGYGPDSGIPTAAFRTTYSRNMGAVSPEVSVTMRQVFLPGRIGSAITGGHGDMPILRSVAVNFEDRTQLSDALMLHYGFSLDSITFLDRLNYFSPFARLSYALSDSEELEFSYTSGNARPDLAGRSAAAGNELQRDLTALGAFPRVSIRNGRARVQRGDNYELAYSRKVGSRTFRISGYREIVSNAALTIAAPMDLYAAGDILPDLYSDTSIFNAGNYQSTGYTASVTQNFGAHLQAALMYGSAGALTVERTQLESQNPDELRAMIRTGRRHAATARVSAHLPVIGTQMAASYQWTDHSWLTPGHLYSTQPMRPSPGLNIYIRQPIPDFSLLPWRMEISADLRNLLAQGYLPLSFADGRSMLLMQTPRTFRGGLSFIF